MALSRRELPATPRLTLRSGPQGRVSKGGNGRRLAATLCERLNGVAVAADEGLFLGA